MKRQQTRKTWGVTFPEPSCRYDDLVDESIFDSGPAILSTIIGVIPFAGLAGAIASLWFFAEERNDNRYGMAEQAWKAAVIATTAQLIWAAIAVVYLL